MPDGRSDRPGRELPSGTPTFLFTDVEGSTRLAQAVGDRYAGLLAEHRAVVVEAIEPFGGVLVNTIGDGLFVAFADPGRAVAGSVAAQRSLGARSWPPDGVVRVRMGLHTGEAVPTPEGDYVALSVHLAARISAAAHGGQILVSGHTAGLLHRAEPPATSFVDRGRYLLAGFEEPQAILQVVHPAIESRFPALRATPALASSLPDLRTGFIGRDDDVKILADLVADRRLVTVLGPGGAGKTRLAVEVAADRATTFSAGAHLADLSAIVDGSLVPGAIASAFAVQPPAGVDAFDALARALGGREALVVLDNCEHVIDAAAAAVDRLLALLPSVRLLATSREPLGVEGEQIWRIPPLGVPPPEARPEDVAGAGSVRLFEDRARLAAPGFEISAANAADVAAICRQLDGSPLGIELVAARVGSMSPAAMAQRLGAEILSIGARRGGRHRNLEATIDWSYGLLEEDDRRLLRSLAIFSGGFSADAVGAVVDEDAAVDGLTGLVDKSLVVYDPGGDRYRLLETVRAFARSRLERAGELDPIAERHLDWCAGVALDVQAAARTAKETEAFALVDRDIDNIRAALAWAERHGRAAGLTVLNGLYMYWFFRAPTEGHRWALRLRAAVPSAGAAPAAMARGVGAACAWVLGDRSSALVDSEAALATARQAGDTGVLLELLIVRGVASTDEPTALALHLEAVDLAERVGRFDVEADVLSNLAAIERSRGDHASALRYAERGLACLAEGDHAATVQAIMRLNLAGSQRSLGVSAERTRPVVIESFRWAVESRSPMILSWALVALAGTLGPDRADGAARLLGAADRLRDEHEIFLDEADGAEVERARERITATIGPDRTDALIRSVGEVSLDQAVELARDVLDRA